MLINSERAAMWVTLIRTKAKTKLNFIIFILLCNIFFMIYPLLDFIRWELGFHRFPFLFSKTDLFLTSVPITLPITCLT